MLITKPRFQTFAEYYVYNDRGTTTQTYTAQVSTGLRIAPEAVLNTNSGLMDAKNTFVISYLHKAIKPLNQFTFSNSRRLVKQKKF